MGEYLFSHRHYRVTSHGLHQVADSIGFDTERNTTVSAYVVVAAIEQLLNLFTRLTAVAHNKSRLISIKLVVQ